MRRPEDIRGDGVRVTLLLATSCDVHRRRRLVDDDDATRQSHRRHRRADHVAGPQRIVAIVTVGHVVDGQVDQCLVAVDGLHTTRIINSTERRQIGVDQQRTHEGHQPPPDLK